LHARSPRTRFFLGDALFDDAFAALLHAGAAAKTRIAAAPLAQSEYGARADHFYAGFRARFGHAPSRLAIYRYDAMSVILDSIACAASQGATSGAVLTQFFITRDRPSILGTYSIDALGDTDLPLFGGWKVAHRTVVFDRTIDVSK